MHTPNLFVLFGSGWICYAEKTHGNFILPYISTARSPQQVMGALVKDFFAQQQVTGLCIPRQHVRDGLLAGHSSVACDHGPFWAFLGDRRWPMSA